MNFPSHCHKCGRRCRNHHTYKNNSRVKNSHSFKCIYQERQFPTDLLSYPIITQTNDNHSIPKNMFSRNTSRKSNKKNILIDQVIQVQQLNTTNWKTQSHMDNNYKKDLDTLKRVQQMIYLRENINNLTYREVRFPNEYIILKRLEEKNNLINQNRFKVDPYFRSLKLQYQTISTLFQNITIPSFIYSKQDPYQSLPTTVEMNDTITNESSIKQTDTSTTADSIDSPIFITPHNEDKPQQYSQNATQSTLNIDYLTKTKKQNSTFDTAVIIDVRKCSQTTTHPSCNISRPEDNQSIYFNQYPPFMDIQQPQAMFIPWSQNSNVRHQIDPVIHHPVSQSIYQTTENQNSFTNADTTSTNTQSIKYVRTITKIKEILDILQKRLPQISSPFKSNQMNQSISTTMTSDSLVTTYSVSSRLNKNISQLPHSKSMINVENEILQMELDSLNNNYCSNSRKSKIKLLNSAKNINGNQQTIDDDDQTNQILSSTQSRSRKPISRHITVQYMSSSFMFLLQILLVICMINRISMYYFFGIAPVDTLVSITVDNSQSNTPISCVVMSKTKLTVESMNDEKFRNFYHHFLKLFNNV